MAAIGISMKCYLCSHIAPDVKLLLWSKVPVCVLCRTTHEIVDRADPTVPVTIKMPALPLTWPVYTMPGTIQAF